MNALRNIFKQRENLPEWLKELVSDGTETENGTEDSEQTEGNETAGEGTDNENGTDENTKTN